jgi:cytosine/adenosine deaminase-related metal-dependent hydrolase
MSPKVSKVAKKPKPTHVVVRGGELITMDAAGRTGKLDLAIENGRITAIGEKLPTRGAEVIDATGLIVMPGLVQAHLHLCQTLFRSLADDLELLDWLRERIWPFEGALHADDLRAAARLGIAELLLGGTTSILDMGTVQHHDVVFEEAERLGLRYTGGKTLMDQGQGYPAGLRETTAQALSESIRLCERWHGSAGGRLRYAFSPRFVLSCTEEALRACVREARARKALLHTHASENSEEIALVRERTGMGNVEYLHHLGFVGPDVVLAHGVWLTPEERRLLRSTRTRVTHCPSSNLKLASGIARLNELIDEGLDLALGADGAACANNLDGFLEMRLTALLHKPRGGPTAVPARTALHLATRGGALALGLDDCGSLEVGHKADLIMLDLHKPHALPAAGDLVSRVVYAAKSSDVHSVMCDGRLVVSEGKLTTADLPPILKQAEHAIGRVRARV